MKDYVKIAAAHDKRDIERNKLNWDYLVAEGLCPSNLDFPLTLQFELTQNCNLKCKHCYNASGVQTFTDKMTPDKWKAFAKYIVDNGGLFQCILSGGEPLLLKDNLFDIMDILHEDGTTFLLITNGMLLSENIVRRLTKYRFMWLQVSIDGANPKRHDSFRGIEGSWEKAVSGAYCVAKYGIPLTIAHSVTPESLEEIDDMCDLAYRLGAGTIILGEITPSGRTMENQDILLSYEQKNVLLEAIERNQKKYAGKMVIERSANTKLQLLKYQNSLNTGAIIRPNGDIRMDCMTPFVIGNVLKEDFKSVWHEKGSTCWNHALVTKYINEMDLHTEMNSNQTNYVDEDILI